MSGSAKRGMRLNSLNGQSGWIRGLRRCPTHTKGGRGPIGRLPPYSFRRYARDGALAPACKRDTHCLVSRRVNGFMEDKDEQPPHVALAGHQAHSGLLRSGLAVTGRGGVERSPRPRQESNATRKAGVCRP